MRIWPSKRRWKHIGIGMAVLLAIVLIANGFMAWRTEARWRGMIVAIRSAGDPASIAELAPKPIPEDQNAAALIAKLGPRLDEFAKDHVQFLEKNPLGIDYDTREDRGQPATAEQMEAIRGILDHYPDIDAGLAEVAACDQYVSVADFSLGYPNFTDQLMGKQVSRFRTAGRFLNWRMETLVAAGQQEKAVEVGIELLRLARQYDHEPTIVSMLVATAVRGVATEALYDALAAGPVSPPLHAALDQELARHEDPQRMVHTLKTERAFAIDATQAMPHIGQAPPAWLMRMFGWPIKRYYVGAIECLDVEIAAAEKDQLGAEKNLGRRRAPQAPTGNGVLADLLVPAVEAAYVSEARGTAVLRTLRIFNALRVFAEKNGREATGLADLPLPKEVTIDLFDGKPLKLKQTDKGWMVYTVMLNGVDDGGDFVQLHDYGVAPPIYRVVQEKEEEETPDEEAKATK